MAFVEGNDFKIIINHEVVIAIITNEVSIQMNLAAAQQCSLIIWERPYVYQ